jgi:hypothetical protein
LKIKEISSARGSGRFEEMGTNGRQKSRNGDEESRKSPEVVPEAFLSGNVKHIDQDAYREEL